MLTYLLEHGFDVSEAPTVGRLDRLVSERGADLVILDGEIEGADPLALARRLSERTDLGILMLSRGVDCIERICSLEAGADDCLAKPVELRELLARVKAILRRLRRARLAEAGRPGDGATVAFGACTLDLASRTLKGPEGRGIAMSEMEFSLLKVFAEHPNRALDRDELAEMAYGRTWTPFDRSLDIRISRLRHKIERDPARPEVILTVRGIGYRFEARR